MKTWVILISVIIAALFVYSCNGDDDDDDFNLEGEECLVEFCEQYVAKWNSASYENAEECCETYNNFFVDEIYNCNGENLNWFYDCICNCLAFGYPNFMEIYGCVESCYHLACSN